jgi:hypothetical protein
MNNNIYILLFFLVLFVFFLIKFGSSGYEKFRGGFGGGAGHGGGHYAHGSGYGRWHGVNRWGGDGGGDGWYGSWIYPVSANCSCPDNYDFVDNLCVSRDYPFEKIAPNCYV